MNHNNLGDMSPCEINRKAPAIELAGQTVGLDLTKPIDCSQMDVYRTSAEFEYQQDYNSKIQVKRTSILHAYVINEDGEQEELTITFELISQRFPKIKQ